MFQMKIFMTSRCSLKCTHCLNSKDYDIPEEHVSFENAIKQIDFITAMGIKKVELGVLVGDSLEYPGDDFFHIINYLERNDNVTDISISTSLIFLNQKHIEAFNLTDKLRLQLSWYGKDDEEYFKIAGIRKGFTSLLNKVRMFSEVKTRIELTVISMFPEKTYQSELHKTLQLITSLPYSKIEVEFDDEAPIGNWENQLTDQKLIDFAGRKGACKYLYADTGISSNGDVLYCAWFDFNKLGVLGNIHTDSPQVIRQRHEKIIQQQNLGIFRGPCRNCEVYGKYVDTGTTKI